MGHVLLPVIGLRKQNIELRLIKKEEAEGRCTKMEGDDMYGQTREVS